MTVHHWPPRPGLSRARARSEVNAMLDGMGISRSVHSMQQQLSAAAREDMVEYYARRAREAQLQADARKGEVYDDDLDTWRQGDPGDECACAVCGREPASCPSCSALCGPYGRVA